MKLMQTGRSAATELENEWMPVPRADMRVRGSRDVVLLHRGFLLRARG